MARKSYSTDLTDMEWKMLAPLIPPAKVGGIHAQQICVKYAMPSIII